MQPVKEQIDKQQLYIDIADTTNIPVTMVKKICEYQFKISKDMIFKGEVGMVKLPYIGKLYRHKI